MTTPPIPENEAQRLAELRALQILDTPAELAYDSLVEIAKELFNVPICAVSLVDSDRQWFKAISGVSVCETSREISFCGHGLSSNQVLLIEDALLDERFADNPMVTGELGVRFYAGAPLLTSANVVVGMFCIIDTKARTFSTRERRLLEMFSIQATALFKARQMAEAVSDQLRSFRHLQQELVRNSETISVLRAG